MKIKTISLKILLVLVVWIIFIIITMTVVKLRVPVNLPLFDLTLEEELVTARGTWVIEGDKQAFPMQTTKLWCEKESHSCFSARAEIGFGDQLYVEMDHYPITEWSNSQIIFIDNTPSCVSYIFTIDLHTKSVTAIRYKQEKPIYANCEGVKDELRMSLKDGYSVIS